MNRLAAVAKRASVKRLLLRLEASFWMTRLSFVWAPMLAPIGWLAAPHDHHYQRLALIMLALGCAGGTVAVINDICDRKKDAITEPQLPMPSGIISMPQAIVTGLGLAIGFVFFLFLASVSYRAFAFALCAGGAAGVLAGLYSAAKRYSLLASLTAAIVYMGIPAIAWCAAGGRASQPLLQDLVYTLLFGFATNIYTGAQDAARDPDVGNSSVALVLGSRSAFLLAATVDVASTVPLLLAAIRLHRDVLGGVLATTSVAVIVGAQVTFHRHSMRAANAPRERWVSITRYVTLSRLITLIAFVAIFSVTLAATTSAVLGLLLAALIYGYRQRITLGGLRTDLQLSR